MAAEQPKVTRPQRIELPIVLMAFSAVAALFCANAARRLYSFAYWPDCSSDPFEFRVGVEGDWDPHWEPQSGKKPERMVWLDPPPWTEGLRSFGADMLVTVEPREAVSQQQGSTSTANGERLISPFREGGEPIVIDPPLVRRIHYRVARVDPAFEGSKTHLFIKRFPDSQFPELAPIFRWGCLMSVLLGFVPGFLWFRALRRARVTTPTT